MFIINDIHKHKSFFLLKKLNKIPVKHFYYTFAALIIENYNALIIHSLKPFYYEKNYDFIGCCLPSFCFLRT